MKKAVLTLICFLNFLIIPNEIIASPLGDAMRIARSAAVRVFTDCVYLIKLKSGAELYLTPIPRFGGNGFFVKSKNYTNAVLTASHVVTCPNFFDENIFPDAFDKDQITTVTNAARLRVEYNGLRYKANLVKLLISADNVDKDLALLDVQLPSDVQHTKVSIDQGDDLDLGDEVWVLGYLQLSSEEKDPRLSSWLIRHSVISDIVGGTIKLREFMFPGESGSMIAVIKEGLPYAVALGTSALFIQYDGIIPLGVVPKGVSWAMRIPKDFVE